MQRTRPPLLLRKSPLVLVLLQIAFQAVRDMASYIPKVQDRLRTQGFPVDVSGEVRELTVQAGEPARETRRPRWEFRNMKESTSIIVDETAVVLQTTAYTRFEEFLRTFELAMTTMDAIVGNIIVERIGLRYIDAIIPESGEDWRKYVNSRYRGFENDVARPDRSVLAMQTVSDTGPQQRMIARLAQNREGMLLPPDLASFSPELPDSIGRAKQGEILTLLDLDHYREARQTIDVENIKDIAWELHDGLEIMFRDIATEYAMTEWGLES